MGPKLISFVEAFQISGRSQGLTSRFEARYGAHKQLGVAVQMPLLRHPGSGGVWASAYRTPCWASWPTKSTLGR